MSSTPVSRREHFARYYEGCGVGPEVLEEVCQAVEEYERLGGGMGGDELLVTETHAAEEDGKNGEAHKLDRLATPAVDEEEGRPIAGDETGGDEDHVTESDVLEVGVDLETTRESRRRRAKTDGLENNGRVETETVEGNLTRDGVIGIFTDGEMSKNPRPAQTTSKKYREGP